MRDVFRRAAALVAVVVFAAPASGQVVNAGFESGDLSPWFAGRRFCNVTCAAWQVTTAEAHTGSFSAGVVGNMELRQNFVTPYAPGTIGSIDLWVKNPADQSPMAFDFFYASGLNDETVLSPSGPVWQQFDVTSKLRLTSPLTGISVWGYDPSGEIYVDDFRIAPAAATTTPEPVTIALVGLGLAGLLAVRRRRA